MPKVSKKPANQQKRETTSPQFVSLCLLVIYLNRNKNQLFILINRAEFISIAKHVDFKELSVGKENNPRKKRLAIKSKRKSKFHKIRDKVKGIRIIIIMMPESKRQSQPHHYKNLNCRPY